MYYDNTKMHLTSQETMILFNDLEKAAKRIYPVRHKMTPADCFNYFVQRTCIRDKIVNNPDLIAYIFFQFDDFLKNPKCLIKIT